MDFIECMRYFNECQAFITTIYMPGTNPNLQDAVDLTENSQTLPSAPCLHLLFPVLHCLAS